MLKWMASKLFCVKKEQQILTKKLMFLSRIYLRKWIKKNYQHYFPYSEILFHANWKFSMMVLHVTLVMFSLKIKRVQRKRLCN